MPLIEILAGHVCDRKVYAADGHRTGRQILQFGGLEPQSDGSARTLAPRGSTPRRIPKEGPATGRALFRRRLQGSDRA